MRRTTSSGAGFQQSASPLGVFAEDSPRSICEVWEGEIFTAAALVMIAPFHRKSRRWRDGGWLAGELMPGIDAGRIAAGMAHGLARAGGGDEKPIGQAMGGQGDVFPLVRQRHAGDDFFGGGHAVESRNVQVLGLGVGHGGYASENAELNILPRSAAADCAAGKAKHGS